MWWGGLGVTKCMLFFNKAEISSSCSNNKWALAFKREVCVSCDAHMTERNLGIAVVWENQTEYPMPHLTVRLLPRALTLVQKLCQNWEFNFPRNCAILTFKPWALSLAFSASGCRQNPGFQNICHLKLVIQHL